VACRPQNRQEKRRGEAEAIGNGRNALCNHLAQSLDCRTQGCRAWRQYQPKSATVAQGFAQNLNRTQQGHRGRGLGASRLVRVGLRNGGRNFGSSRGSVVSALLPSCRALLGFHSLLLQTLGFSLSLLKSRPLSTCHAGSFHRFTGDRNRAEIRRGKCVLPAGLAPGVGSTRVVAAPSALSAPAARTESAAALRPRTSFVDGERAPAEVLAV
jgi:hypothetical protein